MVLGACGLGPDSDLMLFWSWFRVRLWLKWAGLN